MSEPVQFKSIDEAIEAYVATRDDLRAKQQAFKLEEDAMKLRMEQISMWLRDKADELGVAALVAGHFLGAGGQHLVHGRLDDARVGHLDQSLLLDERFRIAAGGVQFGEDLLADLAGDGSFFDQSDHFRQIGRRHRATANIQRAGVQKF